MLTPKSSVYVREPHYLLCKNFQYLLCILFTKLRIQLIRINEATIKLYSLITFCVSSLAGSNLIHNDKVWIQVKRKKKSTFHLSYYCITQDHRSFCNPQIRFQILFFLHPDIVLFCSPFCSIAFDFVLIGLRCLRCLGTFKFISSNKTILGWSSVRAIACRLWTSSDASRSIKSWTQMDAIIYSRCKTPAGPKVSVVLQALSCVCKRIVSAQHEKEVQHYRSCQQNFAVDELRSAKRRDFRITPILTLNLSFYVTYQRTLPNIFTSTLCGGKSVVRSCCDKQVPYLFR